jgi:hypothetical protein
MLTRFIHNREFNDTTLRMIGMRDLLQLDRARDVLDGAAYDIMHASGSRAVSLEPGDATRYNLRVERVGERLVILRVDVHGAYGNALGVISLPLDAQSVTNEEVGPLSYGNPWSACVMAWACAELLMACDQQARARAVEKRGREEAAT